MAKLKLRQKVRRHKPALLLSFTRLSMGLLTRISNRLASKFAYWLWFSSPKFKPPQREINWGQSALFEAMPHQHGPIALCSWGVGPVIILVHGWSGRGLQLAAFAAPLVAAGFRVIAFDAPGHGLSPGHRTTIFSFQQVLSDIAIKFGPVHGIVAHSFGVLVSALAIKKQLAVNKLVCISSPTSAEFLLEMYCKTLQLSQAVEQGLLSRFYREFGENLWQEISAIENLKDSHKPILIIHDQYDRDVPVSKSEQLHKALPQSELMLTEKLGHRRILRDKKVIEKVTAFMLEAGFKGRFKGF